MALCIHVILNFVIIPLLKLKVYLHLGTYSLDTIEGMLYSTSTEKCAGSPYSSSPLFWGLSLLLVPTWGPHLLLWVLAPPQLLAQVLSTSLTQGVGGRQGGGPRQVAE